MDSHVAGMPLRQTAPARTRNGAPAAASLILRCRKPCYLLGQVSHVAYSADSMALFGDIYLRDDGQLHWKPGMLAFNFQLTEVHFSFHRFFSFSSSQRSSAVAKRIKTETQQVPCFCGSSLRQQFAAAVRIFAFSSCAMRSSACDVEHAILFRRLHVSSDFTSPTSPFFLCPSMLDQRVLLCRSCTVRRLQSRWRRTAACSAAHRHRCGAQSPILVRSPPDCRPWKWHIRKAMAPSFRAATAGRKQPREA